MIYFYLNSGNINSDRPITKQRIPSNHSVVSINSDDDDHNPGPTDAGYSPPGVTELTLKQRLERQA